ncbi:MAG: energy-coupling factor ABC transporter permease [Planctomycetota bacterium]|nr:MAG: energy-coupling factor ABC transporter permease [Planctomycetota bacterium]
MANELLTPAVAVALILFAAAALALASRQTRLRFDPAKVPLMGVLGAFVFAAQMINFPILPGTSGHLGGGVLLAILLGPHAATLVMASILIVQCLIFQDGGLLALGANIINLGIVPCYLGYILFHGIAGAAPKAGRIYLAVFAATMIGMVAGAVLVPFEVSISGVASVPITEFLLVMIGLHLLVALGEAIITFLIVGYLCKVRPQVLGAVADKLSAAGKGLSSGAVIGSVLVVALLLGGVFSLFASGSPDALESITSLEDDTSKVLVKQNPDELTAKATELQERIAFLPDYRWTSFSGMVGTIVTLLVVWGISRILRGRNKHVAQITD